jgi:hypothetical protein
MNSPHNMWLRDLCGGLLWFCVLCFLAECIQWVGLLRLFCSADWYSGVGDG